MQLFFLFSPFTIDAKSHDFSNYTGCNDFTKIAKKLSYPSFAITRAGEHLVFLPYTGTSIHHKNIMTFLKPQTPVLVVAEDMNNRFYFVETELANGFISRENLVIIDKESFEGHLNSKKGLLIKPIKIDDLVLPIATKLPVIDKKRGKFKVRIFKPENVDIWLTTKEFTETVSLNKNNFKKISSIFRKKPYCWGNGQNGWDCSGLLVDYFAFFDIALPRNSYQQIQSLSKIDVTNMTLKEKEKILKKSKPFLTLLYFPGHIMLYTGKKGKEFITFQALNRVGGKKYGYVDYIPLKKTGLLSRVTQIGFLEPDSQNLTISRLEDKI